MKKVVARGFSCGFRTACTTLYGGQTSASTTMFNPHGVVLVLEWRVWPKYARFCVDAHFFFPFLLSSILLSSRSRTYTFSKQLFDLFFFQIWSLFLLSMDLRFSFNLTLFWFFFTFQIWSSIFWFWFFFIIIILIKLSF